MERLVFGRQPSAVPWLVFSSTNLTDLDPLRSKFLQFNGLYVRAVKSPYRCSMPVLEVQLMDSLGANLPSVHPTLAKSKQL